MIRSAIAVVVIAASAAAHAAPASVSPAKQELAQRVAQLWHAEAIGQSMLQGQVANAVQQARAVLQGRVAPERQAAAMKDISEDAKKFLDETTPMVVGSAQKLMPTTIVPYLTEHFSEDELRQIIALLESPVKHKFESLVPEMQKTLGEKVASETGPAINPKLQDLKQRIGTRLRTAAMP